MKPESEWGKAECQAIIPEELWNQANQMEALVEKVVIGNGEIDITFSCVPSSEDVCKTSRD